MAASSRPPPFVEIPPDFLGSIATDSERIPQAYFVGRVIRRVFWMRLRLLRRLILRHADARRRCLDFGSGGGVFLPSLAGLFEEVVGVDLETAEAEAVVRHYELDNVRLLQGDVSRLEIGEPFDVIVAADVLEHFRDLSQAIEPLRRWLADDGWLFTSLPTENSAYVLLRTLFGVPKPADHYHTGYEVERALEDAGFRRARRLYVPLGGRIAPLYLVSAWRRD